MATRTFGEPIVEFFGESVTTGTAIVSTTIPPGVEEVMLNGAAAHRIQLAPPIELCLKTIDNEATFTDYTNAARDKNVATVVDLSALSTAANGDYWYLASRYKFGGATIAMTASVNAITSTMTGYYWNGTAWVDASITDNTVSSSKTLAQDQTVTWTTPSAWAKTTLNGVGGLYVMRFQVSVTITNPTTMEGIALLPDTTNSPAGYLAATTDYVFTINSITTGAIGLYAGGASSVSISYIRHSKRGNS